MRKDKRPSEEKDSFKANCHLGLQQVEARHSMPWFNAVDTSTNLLRTSFFFRQFRSGPRVIGLTSFEISGENAESLLN